MLARRLIANYCATFAKRAWEIQESVGRQQDGSLEDDRMRIYRVRALEIVSRLSHPVVRSREPSVSAACSLRPAVFRAAVMCPWLERGRRGRQAGPAIPWSHPSFGSTLAEGVEAHRSLVVVAL
jgi:hypothetical protein